MGEDEARRRRVRCRRSLRGRAWLAGALLLACAGTFGCAPDDDSGPTDSRVDGRDAPVDEASGGDDCCLDRLPDTGDDSGSEDALEDLPDAEAEVASDVEADVEPDTADTVEADVWLPVSCDRSGARDCSAYSSTGRCPDGPSAFGGDVNAGIDATIAGHPEWFVAEGYPSCCPLIQPANVNDYMQAVTDFLDAAGLCASGPGEELGVKLNNDCSESWDIVANPDAETNLVRRHYVGNCFPSFF